ncbi:MAG: ABC transporter ATP-binding protein [Lachnospiraceae bacterium]|nr:ABC transporter ATP-binding protein [Lachnospiraceae bacterium]
MRRIFQYARPYLAQLLWMILSGLGCSTASVGIVDMVKQMIDGGFFWGMAAKAVAVVLLGLLANYVLTRTTGYFGARILRDMRRDLVNHIMKVAPNTMEKQNFGDLMERLSSDVDTVAGYMQTYFKDCLYVPIIVIAFGVYLVSMHPVLAAVCLVPLIIMVPLSIILLRPVKLAQAEYVKRLGLTNNHIQEAFDGVDVIKAYNLQGKMQRRYHSALKETFYITGKNDLWQYNIEPLSSLIKEAPTAVALCVGGYLALRGEMTLGILVAFISGLEKINEPLVYAYQLVIRTQMAMISAKRVLEILDLPLEEEGAGALKKASTEVFALRNITFAYEGQEENQSPVLENFHLSIGEGKRVALVGRSGSGKSTILKLLCRQYEADRGEILFYGNRFEDMGPETIRSRVAFISQEAAIFPMSVWDNIRMGKPDASEEEIRNAAKKSGCHEFIMELPEGYDTLLEERGNNLSGGQRQRISIARAILKDASILLMDEPTSALDRETEELVNETLLAISKGKTVITVAHRLNTITDYEEIVVLEKGRIVESGTQEALMNAGESIARCIRNI